MRVAIGGRRLALVTAVAAVGAAGLLWLGVGVGAGAGVGVGRPEAKAPRGAAARATIAVDPAAPGRLVPAGFLGLSLEYWASEAYAGTDPQAINPVLVALVRNLVPGGSPVLRIGGVTTDKAWWPVAGMTRPPGVSISIDRRWLAVTRALAQLLGARLILGVNLEADSTKLAAAEARALLAGVGRARVEALELGNEPELYSTFTWYTSGGRRVTGRPRDYGFDAFTRDFAQIAGALPPAPVAGPASGAWTWFSRVGGMIAAVPRLGMVTVHRYPLQACYLTPQAPMYPTVGRLLSLTASRTEADSVIPALRVAHADHIPLRIDEMNTISCGSAPGISDTFAMALWALDALFADVEAGVDGVNIHTYPGATYQLFTFTHERSSWQAFVEPEYYGLLMFVQAAPRGSRLLEVTGANGAIRAWATRAPDGRIRVVLINDGTVRPQVVAVRVGRNAHGAATLERLEAPGVWATRGVTLAGQSFGPQTRTGLLAGASREPAVSPVAGTYLVRLPAASAAMLTL